ncbi:MAG: hypothetical protein ACFFCS_18475 [Candidatus Hodarchaeota archaeon]
MVYSVLIIDMYHYQDDDANYQIDGFPTLELAIEFARRWTRDSLEDQRKPGQSRDDLRKMWYMFGEDAMVIGGDYSGSSELDFFLDNPATPGERDWQAIKDKAGIK